MYGHMYRRLVRPRMRTCSLTQLENNIMVRYVVPPNSSRAFCFVLIMFIVAATMDYRVDEATSQNCEHNHKKACLFVVCLFVCLFVFFSLPIIIL